jgi:NAD(P)-dependent dehydrogenase (short-subunit alcohol dehydrogenase family)
MSETITRKKVVAARWPNPPSRKDTLWSVPQALSRSESSRSFPWPRQGGHVLDVTKPNGVVSCVGAAATALGGGIDVLVNNAGWGLPTALQTTGSDRGEASIRQQGALK